MKNCIIFKTNNKKIIKQIKKLNKKQLNQSEIITDFQSVIINDFIFRYINEVKKKKKDDSKNKLLQKFSKDYLNNLNFYKINKNVYLNDDEKFVNFIYENDYICKGFESNPCNKLFKVIDAIFCSKINILSFLSYNDLYRLIDIDEYYIGSISKDYFCNNSHNIQYIINDDCDIDFEKGLELDYNYYALQFNIKKYNKIIINKIINSEDLKNDLQNNLNKYIICDLSTLFSTSLKGIYKNTEDGLWFEMPFIRCF